MPSAERWYDLVNGWDQSLKKAVIRYEIVCGKCGQKGVVKAGRNGSGKMGLPPQMLLKKWHSQGWVIGKRAKDHLCACCLSRRKATGKVVAMKPKVAEAPRQPTREDKRLIYVAIEEHYIDAAKGYAGSTTDAQIAEALDFPRKWVEDVRDEFFGPAGNEEITALAGLIEGFCKRAEEIEGMSKKLLEEGQKLTKRLARVEAK